MGKKRANSEGSIRKRKDSRWEGFYTASYDRRPGSRKLRMSWERLRRRSRRN